MALGHGAGSTQYSMCAVVAARMVLCVAIRTESDEWMRPASELPPSAATVR